MSDLFLDIRGNMIRAMTAEGNALNYSGMFGPFGQVHENILPALKRIATEAGIKIDAVHMVLPYEEIRVQTFKFQKMEYQDAVKVAKRKIMSETGEKEPVFLFTPLGSEGKQQVYLAEILQAGSIDRYQKLFSEQKIRLKTLTTSFQAGLKVFGLMQEPGADTRAVFDIDRDMIEAVVYYRSQPVYYVRHPLESFEVEKEQMGGGMSQERIGKMRLYRIIDSIYKINLIYNELRPDNPIGKIWLCGLQGGTEGIVDALNDMMNIVVAQAKPFSEAGKETYSYTALAGIFFGIADGTFANFISHETQWLSGRSGRIVFAVSGIFYAMCLLSWIYLVESRHSKVTKELEGTTKELKAFELQQRSSVDELKQMEGLQRLEKRQKALYGLLGYLANTLPDGVYLEKILFRQQGERSMLEMEFVTRRNAELGTQKILSRIDEIISPRHLLKRLGEPVVSAGTKGTEKVVRVRLICEVKEK